MAAPSGAGSTSHLGRALIHFDRVLVEDIELVGFALRFVRVLTWLEDCTATRELPQERVEYFHPHDGWTAVGTLRMQPEAQIRLAVSRWCEDHPVDLREFP